MYQRQLSFLFALFLSVIPVSLFADVVKPALIEIKVDSTGKVDIEIRASIEALLTGINSKYKNTQDAPNATEYDALRVLESTELETHFNTFKTKFLQEIALIDQSGKRISLKVASIKIPEPGYIKVPRISLINLSSNIELTTQSLTWYYPLAFGDNAVRLQQIDKVKQQWHWSEWQWLRKDKTSEPFSLTEVVAKQPIYKVITNYIILGFEHIIPKGADHILFILALFFFSIRLKLLLWQITMFTVAHTITLGLSMNGMISLPLNIVEPLIALSIAYAGLENVFAKKVSGFLIRWQVVWRLALVFFFGLLHGLGFASVLSDFGLPADAFATALISFNVGVELGQLAVVMVAFLAVSLWFRHKPWYRKFIVIPVSLLIAGTGMVWAVERLQF